MAGTSATCPVVLLAAEEGLDALSVELLAVIDQTGTADPGVALVASGSGHTGGSPPGISDAAQPLRAAAQLALARRSSRAQTLPGTRPEAAYGGPHVIPRRPAATPAPDPLSRQAPQPLHGCLLHGTGLLLAGERWSDHPACCTHPLLAAVARHVNDHTSDAPAANG